MGLSPPSSHTSTAAPLASVLAVGDDAAGSQIAGLADPTHPQDAATKAYTDAHGVGLPLDLGPGLFQIDAHGVITSAPTQEAADAAVKLTVPPPPLDQVATFYAAISILRDAFPAIQSASQGVGNQLWFGATAVGSAGNGVVVHVVQAGLNTPLTVVDDSPTHVTVNVATDGAGLPTSTGADIVAAVNGTSAVVTCAAVSPAHVWDFGGGITMTLEHGLDAGQFLRVDGNGGFHVFAGVLPALGDTNIAEFLDVSQGYGLTVRTDQMTWAPAAPGGVFVVYDQSYLPVISAGDPAKLGLFDATPIAQPAAIPAPAGGATVDAEARTAIAAILALLSTAAGGYGLTA